MGEVLKVETGELEQLARKIDSCYRKVYSSYKQDISSIRSEIEYLSAKYRDHSGVVSVVRSIQSILRDIEQKNNKMEDMSQKLVTNTKKAASLYKQSEVSSKNVMKIKSVKSKNQPKSTVKVGTLLKAQRISDTLQEKADQIGRMMAVAENKVNAKLQEIRKFCTAVKEGAVQKYEGFQSAWNEALISLCHKAEEAWKALCDRFKKVIEEIKNYLADLCKQAQEVGRIVEKSFQQFLKDAGERIEACIISVNNWIEGIKKEVSRLWDSIKQIAGELYDSFKQDINQKVEEVQNDLNEMKSKVQEVWESMQAAAKDTMTKFFNDMALKLQGEKKFKIPFGPTVTFYAEAYTDYSTVTIGSGIDSDGNVKKPDANIFPSTEIGKIQGDIDGEGNFKGSAGISDENGTTVWIDQTGKTTYSIRKKTDYFATTVSAYVSPLENKTGTGYAIDSRGNEYKEGPWGKIGVKVDWETKSPVPPAVTVEEPESQSIWDKALSGLVGAKDWAVDGAVSLYEGAKDACCEAGEWVADKASDLYSAAKDKCSEIGNWVSETASDMYEGAKEIGSWTADKASELYEGAKDVCSDIGNWASDNKEVIIGGTVTAVVVIGAIALAPETGGASLAALAL